MPHVLDPEHGSSLVIGDAGAECSSVNSRPRGSSAPLTMITGTWPKFRDSPAHLGGVYLAARGSQDLDTGGFEACNPRVEVVVDGAAGCG